jgi:hypothetical protein
MRRFPNEARRLKAFHPITAVVSGRRSAERSWVESWPAIAPESTLILAPTARQMTAFLWPSTN